MKKRLWKMILCGVIAISVMTACSKTQNESEQAGNTSGQAESTEQYVDKEGNIVVPVEDISDKAIFVDGEYNGRTIEVILVKDTSGNVRVAFNTCQVCEGSPQAYYEQQGDAFVCQNCGNVFSVDQIGDEKGGCNPVPVEDMEITDTTVTIPNAVLQSAYDDFANWKGINQ